MVFIVSKLMHTFLKELPQLIPHIIQQPILVAKRIRSLRRVTILLHPDLVLLFIAQRDTQNEEILLLFLLPL